MTREWLGGAAGIVAAAAVILAVSAADAGVMIGGQPNPTWEDNSMLVWLKADAGVFQDTAGTVPAVNNASVALWLDQSTYGRKAQQNNAAYQPTLNTSGLNGHSAILWDDNRRFMLLDSQPTGHQTLFVVYQDTSTRNYATPVGTTYDGKGSYHGHTSQSQVFRDGNTDPKTLNGQSYRNGVLYNGLTTPRPANWALDVHVATDPLAQNVTTIGADNFSPATENRYITGGIAELILYDRALNDYERNAVGNYLAQKYELQTTYYPSEHTPSVYSATVLGDRANQFYRLNESLSLTAVNTANPGTNNGAYTGAYTRGVPGSLADPANAAVHFNGAGHVAVGDLGARPTQGTIEFWMYSDVVENHRNPLSTSGAVGGNAGFRFEQNSAGNFNVRVGSDGGTTHAAHALTNSLTAGQWYHVAVTWDSATNNLQGYLDGRRVFNNTHTGGFPTSFPQVEIGRGFSTSAERWWKGSLDEVAFYNTRLNMADVQWHYQLASIDDSSVVANSIAEFSGLQGQDNWYYGSGAGGAFAQLGTYSETSSSLIGNPGPHWRASAGYPRLWDTGGHPANDNSEPATRRWISEVTGLVRISGRLAKYDTSGGDGIVGEVLVSGEPTLSQAIRHNDDTGVNYTTYAWVQAGQPIDFAIHRGAGNYYSDSTKFTAIVEAMPSATKVFDLAADFNTAENSAANTWHYVLVDGNVRDGSYSLLPGPTTDHLGNTGVNGWGPNYPGIWKNTTGTAKPAFYTDLLSAGAVCGHPGTADGVAAAWVAPYWGFVDIDGFVKLIDPNNGSGNGVNWHLDLGDASGNLDSGLLDLVTGPNMQSFSVRGLEVHQGEVIYLSVLNRGSLGNSNTQMSMVISIIPEPGSMVLLGMGLLLVIGLRWRKPKMASR